MKFYSSLQVCSQIAAQRAANPDLDKLYITKEGSTGPVDQLFMDTAVYTRNRCFRLAFSSKSGKKSFLVPSRRFKCKETVSSWSHIFFVMKWIHFWVPKLNWSCLLIIPSYCFAIMLSKCFYESFCLNSGPHQTFQIEVCTSVSMLAGI